MAKRCFIIPLATLMMLSFNAFLVEKLCAKDKKPTAEEVIAKHLESIGSPEKLAAVKSRTIYGVVAVKMPLGTVPEILPEPGTRKDPSNFLFASTESSMGMLMKFYNGTYTGEQLAYDGKDATIGYTQNGKRSPFADFVARYDGIMREGFLGGTLSTSWPLLHIQDGKYGLKYDQVESGGKKFHRITCTPKDKKHFHELVVRLYFEFETYRHVITEYVQITSDSVWIAFLEGFGNFKAVDGLMLPHSYSPQATSVTGYHWNIEVKQISHNEPIDPQLFRAK